MQAGAGMETRLWVRRREPPPQAGGAAPRESGGSWTERPPHSVFPVVSVHEERPVTSSGKSKGTDEQRARGPREKGTRPPRSWAAGREEQASERRGKEGPSVQEPVTPLEPEGTARTSFLPDLSGFEEGSLTNSPCPCPAHPNTPPPRLPGGAVVPGFQSPRAYPSLLTWTCLCIAAFLHGIRLLLFQLRDNVGSRELVP